MNEKWNENRQMRNINKYLINYLHKFISIAVQSLPLSALKLKVSVWFSFLSLFGNEK